MTIHRFAAVVAAVAVMMSATARATVIANGGFETGIPVQNFDNANPWDWTPDQNGERVNALTNVPIDNGDGTSGPHLIDPLFGNWFGYAENGNNGSGQLSGEVAQSVVVDAGTPVLEFWWRFFTAETPGQENTFNDRFRVSVEGSSTIAAVVADVNSTPMISTNGPLWSPTTNGGVNPGQNQPFGLYTAAWAHYTLNVAPLAGETVTVYFRVNDVGGPHHESSGFGIDNVQFVTPEPSSVAIMATGLLGLVGLILRRRRA